MPLWAQRLKTLEPRTSGSPAQHSANQATETCLKANNREVIKLLDYCFVPYERAKLLTYHHLHPSAASFDLSQAAPGKSADSLRISNGIVPVDPTGTRGRRPSMEDTGARYKTCALSRRS
jgi:hypothetical protein